MKYMNEMLESQKKLEMKRFLYERFDDILEKTDEPPWQAIIEDFDEEDRYKDLYKETSLNYKKTCFLEIIEMSPIEKEFVDTETLDHKTYKYQVKFLILSIRR